MFAIRLAYIFIFQGFFSIFVACMLNTVLILRRHYASISKHICLLTAIEDKIWFEVFVTVFVHHYV